METYNAVQLMKSRKGGTTGVLVGVVEKAMVAWIEGTPDGVGLVRGTLQESSIRSKSDGKRLHCEGDGE